MRLFIALDLPRAHRMFLNRLRLDRPGIRRVPPDQMHLTLSFLGEVDEQIMELLRDELARIAVVSFQLGFSGLGCFPDRQRPRIIWAGLAPEPRLEELAAKVRAAVLSCGIPLEDRAFAPHITLARIKTRESIRIEEIAGLTGLTTLPPFPVTEFILYQSRLSAQGAHHISVKRFPLTASEHSGHGRP